MKAIVLRGKGTSEVEERPVPEIGPDEMLVRVRVCGVCTAESPGWREGVARANGVLGHEPVGDVEKVGANVKGFSPGDRVTGFCLGSFAEYVVVNPAFFAKVPDGLDDIEAFGEPMSCMYSAAGKTPVALGDAVAVVGCGFMGLGMIQLLRLKGAGRVLAVANRSDSLANARNFGADVSWRPEEVEPRYRTGTGWDFLGKGLPAVVEAAGSQSALTLAADMTAMGGTLVVVGFHQEPRTIGMDMWNKKAITVVNAHERNKVLQADYMARMMELVKQGRFRAREMVTHAFRPDGLDRAFAALHEKPDGFIKAYVDFR